MSSLRRRGRVLLPLTAALLVFAAGCSNSGRPQTTLDPQGSPAQSIQNLVAPVFAVAGVVFVIVMFLCLYVPLRFRARDEADYDELPEQVHGNFKAEIAWTIAPALILLCIAVPTVMTIFNLAQKPPKDAVSVKVYGQQWWWEFRYDMNHNGKFDDPQDIITANEMVIPVGQEINLTITSRDVIHSFWTPALNGKRDAVPGLNSPFKVEAAHEGEYVGQCTEYCGLSHANMRLKTIAVPQAEFDSWAANQQKKAKKYADSDTSLEAEGYRLFNQQLCSSCHLINGVNNKKIYTDPKAIKHNPELQVSGEAPNLTHLMTRTTFAGALFDLRQPTKACEALGIHWADTKANQDKCLNRAQLEAWLRNPPKEKPMAPDPVPGRTGGRGMPNLNLTEVQIDQLVAYLKTLK